MAFKVEVAQVDVSSSGIKACELERVTLLELDKDISGKYRTWWGEVVGVVFNCNSADLDLTQLRTLRSALTGNKREKRFQRVLFDSGLQQLNNNLLLVWSRTSSG